MYFDIRTALAFLSDADKGRLFQAILEYAELGVMPDFDGTLGMAWAFVRPQIDRDGDRYEGKVTKSKYAVYVRETKKREEEPLAFDDWVAETMNTQNRTISKNIAQCPIAETATSSAQPNYSANASDNPFSTPVPSISPNGVGAYTAAVAQSTVSTEEPAISAPEEKSFNQRRSEAINKLIGYR